MDLLVYIPMYSFSANNGPRKKAKVEVIAILGMPLQRHIIIGPVGVRTHLKPELQDLALRMKESFRSNYCTCRQQVKVHT